VFGDPFGLVLPALLVLVPLVLAYAVIRLAVRHGVVDAHRQLRREEGSPPHHPDGSGEPRDVAATGSPEVG
jgi:hypothetical protein